MVFSMLILRFSILVLFTYVNIDVERRRNDVIAATRVRALFWAAAGAAHGVRDQIAVDCRAPRFWEGEVVAR